MLNEQTRTKFRILALAGIAFSIGLKPALAQPSNYPGERPPSQANQGEIGSPGGPGGQGGPGSLGGFGGPGGHGGQRPRGMPPGFVPGDSLSKYLGLSAVQKQKLTNLMKTMDALGQEHFDPGAFPQLHLSDAAIKKIASGAKLTDVLTKEQQQTVNANRRPGRRGGPGGQGGSGAPGGFGGAGGADRQGGPDDQMGQDRPRRRGGPNGSDGPQDRGGANGSDGPRDRDGANGSDGPRDDGGPNGSDGPRERGGANGSNGHRPDEQGQQGRGRGNRNNGGPGAWQDNSRNIGGNSREVSAPIAAAGPLAAGVTRVPITFSGGYETDPRDGGRPVVLVANGLGVTPEIFREAFSHVHPAHNGNAPEPEQVRQNKAALMNALSKYGIDNDQIDTVSNYYRYVRSRDELWTHTPAVANALVKDGAVVGVEILRNGAGYSSPPTVSIANVRSGNANVKLAFSKVLTNNGSIESITFN